MHVLTGQLTLTLAVPACCAVLCCAAVEQPDHACTDGAVHTDPRCPHLLCCAVQLLNSQISACTDGAVHTDPRCDPHCAVQLFKSQIHPRIVEMQQLNQQLDALKDQSPVAAETLYRPVLAANDKWNDVLRGIAEREVSWGALACSRLV